MKCKPSIKRLPVQKLQSKTMFWLGGILLTLFAPFLLQEISSQQAWLGVSIALGAYAIAWGVKEDWWRNENPSPKQWISMGEALQHLAYESCWARTAGFVKDEKEFDHTVSNEFRERLARGDIRSRGKPADAADFKNVATRTIPPEYWGAAWFQPGAEIYQADPNRCALTRGRGASDSYRAVIINKRDLIKIWPKAIFVRMRSRPKLTDCIELTRQMFLTVAAQGDNLTSHLDKSP
jgi:hypothetical protein